MRVILACLIATMLAGSAAAADMAPLPEDMVSAVEVQAPPRSDLVSALVVRAFTPGPPWWKAVKGNSTVWIMGSIEDAPADLVWDDSVLKRRIGKASALIIPAFYPLSGPSVTAFKRDGAAMASDTRPLSDRLPASVVEKLRRYEPGPWPVEIDNLDIHLQVYQPKTIVAALDLEKMAERSLGPLVDGGIHQSVLLARAANLPVLPVQTIDPVDLTLGAYAMSDADQRQCLANILPVYEKGVERAMQIRARAQDWAIGDVPAVTTDWFPSLCPTPYAQRGTDQALYSRAASFIAAHAGQGGTIVAVMPLFRLLPVNGIITQLQAKGFTITNPDRLDADDALP